MSDPTDNTILHQKDIEAALADDIRRAITEHDTVLSSTLARALRSGMVFRPMSGLGLIPSTEVPTVVLSASNAASTITNPVTIPAFIPASYTADGAPATPDPRYFFPGCPVMVSRGAPAGAFTYNAVNAMHDSSRQRNVTASFVFDGTVIEILENAYSTKTRILVDGKVVTTGTQGWAATDTTGGLSRRKLTFATRAQRIITVQNADNQFPGVTIGPSDSIYAPPMPKIPRAIAIGDSVTAGQNIDLAKLAIWPTMLSGLMGWDVWDAGQGGTGYMNPGTYPGFANFQGRLATDVTPYAPDVVIAAGGLNDQDSTGPEYTSAARRAAIQSFITATKAALPNALIILVGPFYTRSPEPLCDSVHTDLSTVAAANPGVLFIPTQDHITGTGNIGAPSGSGNGDYYLSNDSIHPTAAGHEAWARWISTRIVSLLSA